LQRRRTILQEQFQIQRQLNRVNLETVMALAEAIEMKDPYTKGHCSRVRDYSILMAREYGLSRDTLYHLTYGSLLHDCGKIGISENILLLAGSLDQKERKLIERHAVLGFEITNRIDSLKSASLFIRQHHERWDGKGYPDHLREDEIHICSRMIAVADAFDAMTSDRPYRAGMKGEKALKILEANSGTQFDPQLVTMFRNLMQDRKPGDVFFTDGSFSGSPSRILLVDDERNVINAIARVLLDEPYEILTAESGAAALDLMNRREVDLIISDHRMPGMTGVEFLKKARSRQPSAVRIMLSGYADTNAALEAINEAGIYQFLVKPWDDKELIHSIVKALEWRQMYASTFFG